MFTNKNDEDFFQYSLEICLFSQVYIFAPKDQLADYATKEQCSVEVKRQFPNATGVIWDENTYNCYASYGNKKDMYYDDNNFYWSCLFEGNEISIDFCIMSHSIFKCFNSR